MKLHIALKCAIAGGLLMLALPAWAGAQIQKTLKLNPGGRFILEADEGSVDLMGSDQNEANIAITGYGDHFENRVDFSFDDDGNVVRVREKRRYWDPFEFLFDPLSLHYDIRVPKNTSLEIRTGGGNIRVYSLVGRAELSTSGGEIEVSSVTGDVSAHTSGGHIRVDQTHGQVDMATSGGGLEADSIDGSLNAKTSGGPIRIHGVTGRVDARTSGGSIEAIFSKGNQGGGVLETSGGSIYARLDPAVNLELDASSSGGGVSSNLPIRQAGWNSRDSLRGTLGSGGNVLRLHTSGGGVRIESF